MCVKILVCVGIVQWVMCSTQSASAESGNAETLKCAIYLGEFEILDLLNKVCIIVFKD